MASLRRPALGLLTTLVALAPQAASASIVPAVELPAAPFMRWQGALMGADYEFYLGDRLRVAMQGGQGGSTAPWLGLRLSGPWGEAHPERFSMGWSLLGYGGNLAPDRPLWGASSGYRERMSASGGVWLSAVAVWPVWGERLKLRGMAGPNAFWGARSLTSEAYGVEQRLQGLYVQPFAWTLEVASQPFPGWPEFLFGGGQMVGIRWQL